MIIRKLNLFAMIIFMLCSMTGAYQLVCLNNKEELKYSETRYVCKSETCKLCINDGIMPVRPGLCDDKKSCITLDQLNNIAGSKEKLVVNLNSPISLAHYNRRSVLIDLNQSMATEIYISVAGIKGNEFKRLSGFTKSVQMQMTFREGYNEATIKVVDRHDRVREITRRFFVDTKDPVIKKVGPSSGFVSDRFDLQFVEDYPESIVLHYGNNLTGMRKIILKTSDCEKREDHRVCSKRVELMEYEGQLIEYNFEVSDRAKNKARSKIIKVMVDRTAPVINNDEMFFIRNNSVVFRLNVSEENPENILYVMSSNNQSKPRVLCKGLIKNICEKTERIPSGEHVIELIVIDKANNTVTRKVGLSIPEK